MKFFCNILLWSVFILISGCIPKNSESSVSSVSSKTTEADNQKRIIVATNRKVLYKELVSKDITAIESQYSTTEATDDITFSELLVEFEKDKAYGTYQPVASAQNENTGTFLKSVKDMPDGIADFKQNDYAYILSLIHI